ncbi:MAG: ATP-binding protein [Ginsengibacter sp.]
MSFEPFLIFFLIRYLRKSLKIHDAHPEWDRILLFSTYGVVVLFIFEITTGTHQWIGWLWQLILIGIIWLIFNDTRFNREKPVFFAVLPLILLNIFSKLLKVLDLRVYEKIEIYLDFAFCVAITWMVSALIKSSKQKKALDQERKKTQEEEERSKFIAAQKDKLEVLVNERTSELMIQKEELQQTITELKETQAQLIQSEKMASLGELTAGIAHEIQNPLNFVNNFSEVNRELVDELQTELKSGNTEEAVIIANDIKLNEEKINHHGKRADAIVKGMLQHSRKSTGQKEPTDINALCDEYLRLSYHGLRAKDKTFNATMKTDFDESLSAGETGAGKINVIAQDIGRVILNLFNNAFYAVKEQKSKNLISYEPIVSVSTKKFENRVCITVSDNGSGIPQKVLDKIFQPFFTTKPTGEGTGLGLSLSYDIIKAHGGEIKVESIENEGTKFIIQLPISK